MKVTDPVQLKKLQGNMKKARKALAVKRAQAGSPPTAKALAASLRSEGRRLRKEGQRMAARGQALLRAASLVAR